MTEVAAFARDCANVARQMSGRGLRTITEKASQGAKVDALGAAISVLGGDLRARNFGGRRGAGGARFGVRYDLQGNDRSTMRFTPVGGWVLFEEGADPHPIGQGRRSRRRSGRPVSRGGAGKLKIGSNVVTGPVQHPGTRGKRIHSDAVRRIDRNFGRRVDEVAAAIILGGLRGR